MKSLKEKSVKTEYKCPKCKKGLELHKLSDSIYFDQKVNYLCETAFGGTYRCTSCQHHGSLIEFKELNKEKFRKILKGMKSEKLLNEFLECERTLAMNDYHSPYFNNKLKMIKEVILERMK